MKLKTLKIVNLILALFLFVFTIGYTFAWFTDQHSSGLTFKVETSGYFAQGDGSATSPFVINSAAHLFNVAYLQALGRLQNTDNSGYYFTVDDDLDMGSTVIPPIGNEDYPFVGNFDGSGHTISNVKVSTAFDDLTSMSFGNDAYTFSRSVGLFGKVSSGAYVANFILDNPIVKVASENDNTRYASSTISTPVVGLAAGYIETTDTSTNLKNIGVIGGKLIVNNNIYQSYNSIVGATTGTDNSGEITDNNGSDTGYFISDDLIQDITNDLEPYHVSSPADGVLSFTTQSLILGSQWLSRPTELESSLGLGAFAISTHYSSGTGTYINSSNQYRVTADTDIYDYTSDTPNTLVKYSTVNERLFTRTGRGAYTKFDTVFQLNSKSNISSTDTANTFSVYSDGTDPTAGNAVDGVTTEDLYIQDQNIKVIIQHASVENPAYITLLATSNSTNSTILFTQTTKDIEAVKTYNPIYTYFRDGNNKENISETIATVNFPTRRVPVAQRFSVTESGIYTLTTSSSGVRFFYLSVSGIAGTTSTESATGIDNVDFLYDNVAMTVADNDYTFTVGTDPYVPSAVVISFDTTSLEGSTYVIYFERKSDGTAIVFAVYYTAEPQPTANPEGTVTITQTTASATDWIIPTAF